VQLLEMEGFSEACLVVRSAVKELANIACSLIAAVLTGAWGRCPALLAWMVMPAAEATPSKPSG
jgi:hypothetical protein